MIASLLLVGLASAETPAETPADSPAPPAAPAGDRPVAITRLARGFVNVWVLRSGDDVVLVDTHYAHRAAWVVERLADLGVAPASVRAIVVTHAHGDHGGGAAPLRDATGAPVILGAADAEVAASGRNPPVVPTGFLGRLLRPSVQDDTWPPFQPDVLVSDRLDLRAYGIAGEAIAVGGHTAGSLIVSLAGGDVFVSDQIRGRLLAPRRPTEHFFQPDRDAVHTLLRRVVDDGAARLYPGHGDVLDAADVGDWLDRQADAR